MERVKEENVEYPDEAIAEVLDHYWKAEIENFRRAPTSDHVLHALAKLANRYMCLEGWTAEEYVIISSMMPEMTWNVGLFALKYVRPGELIQKADADAEVTWETEGPRRYRLQGRKPSVVVIVGWDRPLATLFAQVWEVPEGENCYERGDMLLWLGLGFREIQELDGLKEKLEPFVTLPESLAGRLALHKAFDL